LTLLSILLPVALAGAKPVTPDYDGNCQSPKWAPDGSKLAYEVNYHDRKVIELYVYQPGAGPARVVRPVERGSSSMTAGFASSKSDSVVNQVSWAPSFYDRFVYSASTNRKDYDLFIDGGGPVAAAPGADGEPNWSADGHHIVFTSARTGEGDLYVVNVRQIDKPPRRITKNLKSSELYATFGPNNKSIAYVAHTKSGDNLYLIDDHESPVPRAITNWPRTQTRPSWSPDGSQIAFYANKDEPQRFDLYTMRVGGKPSLLARGVVMNVAGPTWTPDGGYIVFVRDDDEKFDPVWMVAAGNAASAWQVPTDTVGNEDLDLVRGTDGRIWLAVVAQGKTNDAVRDYKRIYVMEIKLP
jgi:Tol biopolymer transport system component